MIFEVMVAADFPEVPVESGGRIYCKVRALLWESST